MKEWSLRLGKTLSESQHTDQEMVNRIINGIESAERELTRRYQGNVKWYAQHKYFSLTEGEQYLTREDLEDVVQAVFIKATRSLNTYSAQKGEFSTWIYRITRNTVIDFYRREKRRPNTIPKSQLPQAEKEERVDILESFPESSESDPLEKFLSSDERKSRNERINECLKELTETQLEIFLLMHSKNMSQKDIASQRQCSESAVSEQLARGEERLSKCLKKKEILKESWSKTRKKKTS